MSDAQRAVGGGDAALLPDFVLYPATAVDREAWWHGTHAPSGRRVVARRCDRIPFAAALQEIARAVDVQDRPMPGVMPSLAVVMVADGVVAAAMASPESGLSFDVDQRAAGSLQSDATVDVFVIYEERGEPVLERIGSDVASSCADLAALATVVDSLAAADAKGVGHGSLDVPCLRTAPSGPVLLGVGLAGLESCRRTTLDTPGPWQVVPPEMCLPPGEAVPTSDQYALAILWAAARTGLKPPFPEADRDGVIRAKFAGPCPLDGLAAESERGVVARAVSPVSADRFDSCSDFVAAIREAVASAPPVPGSIALEGPPVAVVEDPPPPPPDVPVSVAERGKPADSPPEIQAAPISENPGVAPVRFAPDTVAPAAAAASPAVADEHRGMGKPPAVPAKPPQPLAGFPYKPGDLILPGYRLVRKIGAGGFGEVWRAAAPGGMSVAIKVIANLNRREGAREYRALNTVKDIHHAHIVPMFGVWLKASGGRVLDEEEASAAEKRILSAKDPGLDETIDSTALVRLENLELVIAMGLGDSTLYDRLQAQPLVDDRRQGLEVQQLLDWMRQAALAIDYFNRGQGRLADVDSVAAVQHCDIKPQNMLLVGNAVQVCDFGLARAQDEVRRTSNNLLSVAYAAPEMTVKPHDPSPKTDQYSLAVAYYELRTGQLPYECCTGDANATVSPYELLRAKAEGRLDLSAVPAAEARALRRALAIAPAERFGSCEELVDAIQLAVERDAAEPVPRPHARPTAASWWKPALVTMGGLAGIALTVAIVLRPPRKEDASQRVTNSQTTVDVSTTVPPVTVPPVTEPVISDDKLRQTAGADTDTLLAEAEEMFAAGIDASGYVVPEKLAQAATMAKKAEAAGAVGGASVARSIERVRNIDGLLATASADDDRLDKAVGSLDAATELPKAAVAGLGRRMSALLLQRAQRVLRQVSAADSAKAKREGIAKAAADVRAALRLDGDSWEAHNELGRCETLSGNFADAERCYTAALAKLAKREGARTDPGAKDEILARRAYALVQDRRFLAAADDYSAIDGRSPATLAVKLWDLQHLAAEAGDLEAVTSILTRVEQIFRSQPDLKTQNLVQWEVLNTLAWYTACNPRAVAEAGRRAVDLAMQALAMVPEESRSQVLDTLAAGHARAGDWGAARERIDEAIDACRSRAQRSDLEAHREAFSSQRTWDTP